MKTAKELADMAVAAQIKSQEDARLKKERDAEALRQKVEAGTKKVLDEFWPRAISSALNGARVCTVCEVAPADYKGFNRIGYNVSLSNLHGVPKLVADTLAADPLGYKISLRYDQNSHKDRDTLEYVSDPRLYLEASW